MNFSISEEKYRKKVKILNLLKTVPFYKKINYNRIVNKKHSTE